MSSLSENLEELKVRIKNAQTSLALLFVTILFIPSQLAILVAVPIASLNQQTLSAR